MDNAETTNTNVTPAENATQTPSVEDLMAQIAAQKAEAEKWKSAFDKTSSDYAKAKKEIRSKQTAEEQAAEEQAEAERRRAEETEQLRNELNHLKAVAVYKDLPEKVVETLIEAVSDGDHSAIAAIIDNEKKAAVKLAQAEWLKSRPQASVGTYSQMSREQIMAIGDREERKKAIAQNISLFGGK